MIQKITYWFFSVVDAYMHYKYGSRKRKLFIGHPEELVEIGAGYGANFRYLEPGTKVIAIEPNAGLHRILRERAQNFEIDLVVYEAFAEEMPLSEASAEMVVSSLVLCSVKDPEKAISEIKRILKPEGKFIYLEHVKAHNQPIIGFVQRLIKVP
ncbi:MAG: class I SAM-dependent methyltransferase, partial [Balneolaceae bacterium]